MKYKGSEIIVEILERFGVKYMSGIPGGSNLPLYDALYKSKIKHILARHEQGAGFIAQGMARVSGNPAVCLATSGPGATNLLTAIADARMDSIPIVAITGQVSSSLIGTDAFQEVDTYGLTLPITKHNFLVRDIKELFSIVPEAFRIAQSHRPGPVCIDIPKDIQMKEIDYKWSLLSSREISNNIQLEGDIEKTAEWINNSRKPILYIGGGVIHSEASRLLIEVAKKNSIPVVSTLMGLGAFPSDDPLYLGMLGMHGARYTNFILKECDLLIALGVRFDDRATGKVEEFCPNSKIIHANIDISEIDKIKKSHISLVGNIREILTLLKPLIKINRREEWIKVIQKIRKDFPMQAHEKNDPFNPVYFIKKVSDYTTEEAIIVTDVGQHQMWVAQHYPFKRPRTFLTSGGLGTMGFGLPVSIGASLAKPDATIILFTGDGSLLMNIQELATLAELNCNVKILLFNNGQLGLVRQQQELFYDKHYIASKFERNPDFKKLGESFGIESFDLSSHKNPYKIIKDALGKSGPVLINVPISPDENVLPMVPPGAPNTEMIGG